MARKTLSKPAPQEPQKPAVNNHLVIECIAGRIDAMARHIACISDLLYTERDHGNESGSIAAGCEIILCQFAEELRKMGADLAAIAKGGVQ